VEAVSDRLDLNPALTSAPSAVTFDGEFRSVLSRAGEVVAADAQEPTFFKDLNLDQVVEAIVGGRDEYDVKPFFYTPLHDVETVEYRQEIFRDLEREDVREAVRTFAEAMRRVRNFLTLAQKQHYKYEKERWFLDAATVYRDAVSTLVDELTNLELGSSGLRALREYLAGHTTAERFMTLALEIDSVRAGLDAVRYTVRIKGARVTVSGYHGERDYTVEVEETFARFRQGAAEDHLMKIPDSGSMDHVEARIAQLVARLYPTEFGALDEFCVRQRDFLDPPLARFDREVQFYLAYLDYIERLKARELIFSYPTVSDRSQESSVEDAFDIALAAKLASESAAVVRNDFFLRGPERILVVTGPNQGGKTTFARMFGQLHYLARLGVPVPARSARLFLPDRVFTHFEVEEDIATLRGKLDDELVRIRDILEQATGESIVILNEIFASTSLADAVYLGTEVLKQLIELGCLTVCVTFVDELSALGEVTVSMVATVAPDDPSTRTFKIVRRVADGRAYAWALADKYGLSHERLRNRISR
jgi:DNA mismatch repair protein MutS